MLFEKMKKYNQFLKKFDNNLIEMFLKTLSKKKKLK